MDSVKELVEDVLKSELAYLADEQRRSEVELNRLERVVRQQLCNGLPRLLKEAHVVVTDDAGAVVYEECIEPWVESIIEFFRVEDYPRDEVEESIYCWSNRMAEDLSEIIERHADMDRSLYEEQFRTKY